MTLQALKEEIRKRQNFLCVGLDSDISRIPAHLREKKYPILEFNKAIIEATKEHCVAYKLNTAFYESSGSKGWEQMEATLDFIPDNKFVIADAKRGDIGNTAKHYARAFFEHLDVDALTLNPYMGMDTLEPYAEYTDKTLIVLGLTSNRGSEHIEQLCTSDKSPVYLQTMQQVANTVPNDRLMFVIGATHGAMMKGIRDQFPNHFFLVPGVGAQGGSADEVYDQLSNRETGILINSSRSIIFASDGEDFANAAQHKARELAEWMASRF